MENEIVELFKEKTKKECYKVNLIDGEPSILDDKIGGVPYLPVGEEYPKTKHGNNLALLLQVNLKNIDLEGYPKNGILEIFIDPEVDYPCKYQVKYFEEGLEYQTDFPQIDLDMFIVQKPIKITLEKTIDYMPIGDYRFVDTINEILKEKYNKEIISALGLEEILGNKWYELFDYKTDNYITIGGYADFTQTDPRENKNSHMSECIFKLDSCMDLRKFCIGDSGILFTLISPNDLKECKFENAFVDWDCC